MIVDGYDSSKTKEVSRQVEDKSQGWHISPTDVLLIDHGEYKRSRICLLAVLFQSNDRLWFLLVYLDHTSLPRAA